MTVKCWMCGKFLSEDWRTDDDLSSEICHRCVRVLGAEFEEAEVGIGNGQAGTPDKEYCRHCILRQR